MVRSPLDLRTDPNISLQARVGSDDRTQYLLFSSSRSAAGLEYSEVASVQN